jgi:kynurenine--oxoglutarate transaminase/cysteine-S-conjugate beta-lyase/glutamine--phenylpyruvate transaminase
MADKWAQISTTLEPFQYTVWTEFTPLAIKYQATNLGQGFPNFKCPDFVKTAVAEAALRDENQYVRSQGHPDLVREIAVTYSEKYCREVNPLTEVVVTMGASEALLCAMLSLVDPGDEVLFLEPVFDIYIPQINMAGGIPVGVPMRPPTTALHNWEIDFEAFEQAFTTKTRVLILNSPHNPVGKVLTREECQRIAEVLERWPNVVVVSDEVYEYITFDGRQLESIATYGNLWERSVTISSAGKIFSITGWKTGWGVGGAAIVRKMAVAHQWTTYCSNSVCQAAIAVSLRQARLPYEGFYDYYQWLRNEYTRKRTTLLHLLSTSNKISVRPIIPEGGFFVIGEIDPSMITDDKYLEGTSPDFAFCRWMTESLGVCAIPCSAFFTEENKHLGQHLVRFAICKTDEDFAAAALKLS